MERMARDRTGFETNDHGEPKRWSLALALDAQRGDIMPALNALVFARLEGRFDDRAFLASIVGPACPPEVLQRAGELMPRAPEPCILHAAHLLGRARSETELCIAIAHLVSAARIDDADPTPHALRVGVAHLLGAPTDGRIAFRDAVARDPLNHYAYRAMVRLLSQGYRGSHTEALQVARHASAIAPIGSDLHGCLFEAHVEVWRSMRYGDESAAHAYLESEYVRHELDVAFDTWLADDYRPRLGSGPGLGAAALWYFQTGDEDRLHQVRTIIREAEAALRAA